MRKVWQLNLLSKDDHPDEDKGSHWSKDLEKGKWTSVWMALKHVVQVRNDLVSWKGTQRNRV